MAKFLFVYRDNVDNMKEPSPEEMQEILARWGAWFQELGPAVVDGGDGLMPDGKLLKPDGAVTDGPFIEAKELVGGYSVVEAEDLDQAADFAKGCPVLKEGGTVEVRQLAGFGEG